jgi:hypothetical protein
MRLKDVTSEEWEFIIDHTEKQSQGVHLYYKGVKWPRRVYYDRKNDPNFTLRTLNALGVVKKYLFSLTYLKGVVVPYRLSIKKYEQFFRFLYLQFEWVLCEFYIKDEEFSVPVWELGRFVRFFLQNIGFSEELSNNYAKIVMMILEFDNAYRYRVQDIFNNTSNLKLQNPYKEWKRLLKIYAEREGTPGAYMKLGIIKWLLLVLWIPKFKRAFLDAINQIDVEKIKFDDNDRFHFSFWKGYDFEGKNFEQRFSPYEEEYKTIPFYKRQSQEIINGFLTGK